MQSTLSAHDGPTACPLVRGLRFSCRAMTTVSNKTHRPLSVPLPRGKTLHLGPGKTGQISSKDIEHPPLKKLADAGEIEILGEDSRPTDGPGGGRKGRTSTHGHTSGSGIRRSGDR